MVMTVTDLHDKDTRWINTKERKLIVSAMAEAGSEQRDVAAKPARRFTDATIDALIGDSIHNGVTLTKPAFKELSKYANYRGT